MFIVAFVSSCSNESAPPIDYIDNGTVNRLNVSQNQSNTILNYSKFSYDLLNYAVKCHDEDENVVISPWGAASVMAILANESDATASRNIAHILYADQGVGDVFSELNTLNKYLYENLPMVSSSAELNISRILWKNNAKIIDCDFENALTTDYNARIESFENISDLQNQYDKWLVTESNGHIPTWKMDTGNNISLMIAEAFCFNGKWVQRFDEAKSSKGAFRNQDGTTTDVTMMKETFFVEWRCSKTFDSIVLRLGHGFFELTIILPKGGETVTTLASKMNNFMVYNVDPANTEYNIVDVYVELPRVNINEDTDLSRILKEMDVTIPLSFESTENLKSESSPTILRQNISLTLKESGTGKPTSLEESGYTHGANGSPFIVDRPFIYILKEKSTGLILQMGKIAKL